MKSKEEIEQLAKQLYIEPLNKEGEIRTHTPKSGGMFGFKKFKKAFTLGYTQCQEDMANKKYTEADIKKAINVGISAEAGDYPNGWSFKLGISLEDYYINSLNKQD